MVYRSLEITYVDGHGNTNHFYCEDDILLEDTDGNKYFGEIMDIKTEELILRTDDMDIIGFDFVDIESIEIR